MAYLNVLKKTLNIREIGDLNGTVFSLHNIGSMYYMLGDYNLAIEYFKRALTIRKKIGFKQGIGYTLSNLGALKLNFGT